MAKPRPEPTGSVNLATVIQFTPGYQCHDLQLFSSFTSKLPVINTKTKGSKSEYFLHTACKTPAAQFVQVAMPEFHRPCGLKTAEI